MIYEVKTSSGFDVKFDEEAIVAFKQGKQLQISYNEGEWKDWSMDQYPTMCFGPWYYAECYKWRVKPDTIEVDVEIKTVVKTKVEIPIPFKGTIDKNQEYFIVKHSTYKDKWWISDCCNAQSDVGVFDVKNFYVYLDTETAQKAVDILNGKNGESK